MRTASLLLLLAIVVPACRKPAGQPATAGDLQVELAIDPDPPVAGDNRLRLTLRDATGKPVDGARLDFLYDMPAMGSMPEMKGGGESRALGGGRYEIAYGLSMLGDWTLTIGVAAEGHPPAQLRLKISPPRKGFAVEARRPSGRSGETAGLPSSRRAGAGQAMDIPPARQQLIGVTFATVEERPLVAAVRAAGHVEVDERRLADVTLKFEAYVQKLFVAETGKRVQAGTPLLRLYSADLLAAEDELLQVRRAAAAGQPGAADLLRAARRRLRFWDLTPEQIAAVESRGRAEGTLVVPAPASGVVLEKGILEGARAMPGTMLFRIGNLGRVWVQAELYESDAPLVALGQPAQVSLPSLGSAAFRGRVSFVAPTVDVKTRTLQARIELQNPGLALKPGMFADVRIEAPLGVKLAVPDAALLLSGEHRYAFVARGEDHLLPVEVKVGVRAGDDDEVLEGLARGDRVVLGGNFLVASEAQLRDALPRWSDP